jgi:PAS domain S-box-containing protein
MSRSLRLLIVEDSEEDACLLVRELHRAGYDPTYERVETSGAMAAALEGRQWDAVLSDHRMPRFSSSAALTLLKEKNLDIPFIVVSGALPEESAIEIMRAGARDFISKQNLARLAGALDRELADAEVRRAKRQVQEASAEKDRLATLVVEVIADLAHSETLREGLQRSAEIIVQNIDAAFARIWTLNEAEKALELEASAGIYTHINGSHGRVPLGEFKIGRIAESAQPHLTNEVMEDSWVGDKEWAQREGMVAFAGYPLVVQGRVVGVVAAFARHSFSDSVVRAFAAVANAIAVFIVRKRAEESLQLRTRALDAAANSVVIVDRTGRIVWINDAFTTLTGYEPAESLGKTLRILKSGKQGKSFYETLWQTILSGKAWHGELINRRKDGTLYNEEQTITPVREHEEEITHFIAIKQDISERKREGAAFRTSEEQFRQVADNLHRHVFFVASTEAPRTLYLSPAYEEIWGRPVHECLERPEAWIEAIHSDDREQAIELLARSHRGEPGEGEYRVVRPDGSVRHIRAHVFPVRDALGKFHRMVGVAEDVTEHRLAEEALRASEAQFRGLAENIHEVFFVNNPDPARRMTYISPAYEEIWVGHARRSMNARRHGLMQSTLTIVRAHPGCLTGRRWATEPTMSIASCGPTARFAGLEIVPFR